MKIRGQLLAVLSWCLLALPVIGELLRCPECTNMVSAKAPGCPKCGAPIEFIKQKNISPTNAPAQDLRNCAIQVVSDTAKGLGVAVKQGGKEFVIIDQRLIDGAEQLALFATTTNLPVMYSSLELADDRPLARLAIDGSSVRCMTAATKHGDYGQLTAVSVISNGAVRTNTVTVEARGSFLLSTKEPVDHLLCLWEGSDAVAVVQAGAGDLAIGLPPASRWVLVKPGEYRRQTKLLRMADELGREPGATAPTKIQTVRAALQEAQWLTQHLRQRGEAALRNLEKEGKAL